MVFLAEISNWGVILLIWWLISMFLGKKKKKLQRTGEVETPPPPKPDPFDFIKTIRENLPVDESYGKSPEIIHQEPIEEEIYPKVEIEPPASVSEEFEEELTEIHTDDSYYQPTRKVNHYRKLLRKKYNIKTAIILKEILDKPKAFRSNQ